ncbi:MAG: hypothetical protein ACLFOY_15880 [Desulfatibacillaceae bacterium]
MEQMPEASIMDCPKCRRRQKKSDECIYCGVVVSKYLPFEAKVSDEGMAGSGLPARGGSGGNDFVLVSRGQLRFYRYSLLGLFLLAVSFGGILALNADKFALISELRNQERISARTPVANREVHTPDEVAGGESEASMEAAEKPVLAAGDTGRGLGAPSEEVQPAALPRAEGEDAESGAPRVGVGDGVESELAWAVEGGGATGAVKSTNEAKSSHAPDALLSSLKSARPPIGKCPHIPLRLARVETVFQNHEAHVSRWRQALRQVCASEIPEQSNLIILFANTNLLFRNSPIVTNFDANASKTLLERLESLSAAEVLAWTQAFKSVLAGDMNDVEVGYALLGVDSLYDDNAYQPERGAEYRDRLAGIEPTQLAAAATEFRGRLPAFGPELATPLDPVFAIITADRFFKDSVFDEETFAAAMGRLESNRA